MKKKPSFEEVAALQAQYSHVQDQIIVLRRLLKEQRELLIVLRKKYVEYGLRQNGQYYTQKNFKNTSKNTVNSCQS